MYQAHFGLKTGIFESGIAHEEAVFIGPRQQLIVANFKVALTTSDSAIVLTGAAGVGKTTLTAAALRATTTRLALGWLNHPPINGPEVLELLLAEFGLSSHRMGRVERLQTWRQFLNEMNATNSRVFVVIERADEMETEVLRTLEAVTAAEPSGGPGVNLVLLGQAELNDRLKVPALASLNQRVRLRQHLDPLTIEELDAYLKHRVTLAGGNFEQVFAHSAIDALHRYSAGLPRVVNNLCETALTLAATGEERQLTAQLIARVAVGLYGMEPIEMPLGAVPIAAGEAAQSGGTSAAPEEIDIAAGSLEVGPANVEPVEIEPTEAEPAGVEAVDIEAMEKASAAIALALAALVDADARSEIEEIVAITGTPQGEPRRSSAEERAQQTPSLALQLPQSAEDLPVLTDAVDEHAQTRPSSVAARVTYQPIERLEPTAFGPAEVIDLLAQLPAPAPSSDDLHEPIADELFDDADLDMLSAALASAGWSDLDDDADLGHDITDAAEENSVTMETPRGMFSSFGNHPARSLELLDEQTAMQTNDRARSSGTTR